MTPINYKIGLDCTSVVFERTDIQTNEVLMLKYQNGGRFEFRDLTKAKDDFKGDYFVFKNQDGTDGGRLSLINSRFSYRILEVSLAQAGGQ